MVEPIGVGINGGGRIGILTYKALQPYIEQGIIKVIAINEIDKNATPQSIARYILRDSVHRLSQLKVEYNNSTSQIIVNGRGVDILKENTPANLQWKNRGVKIVIEATGAFTSANGEKGGYMDHVYKADAEYVVISAPVSDDIAKTVVLGVNYSKELLKDYKALSNASCTTNDLAPIVKVLHERFGIVAGDMITIHSYTNDQKLVDAYHKDPRRARAAALNVIPTTTGASKAIGLIFPELKGKISENAIAYRVPVPDGSVVDFNVKLAKEVTPQEVNNELKKAAESLEGILAFTMEPIVSQDIVGDTHSSTVDGLLTAPASEGRIKVVSWYDNEWGYSNRTAELTKEIAEFLKLLN